MVGGGGAILLTKFSWGVRFLVDTWSNNGRGTAI